MGKKEKKEKEIRSKAEKYYTTIVFILAFIAIAIVLIVFIPKAGKTNEYTKDYKYLDYENVFEKISVEDLKQKVEAEEDFHVVLCNKNLKKANYFMCYVDELAMENEIETIYYIKTDEISTSDKNYIRQTLELGKDILDAPNIIYFNDGVTDFQTHTTDYSEFANSWDILCNYFENYR